MLHPKAMFGCYQAFWREDELGLFSDVYKAKVACHIHGLSTNDTWEEGTLYSLSSGPYLITERMVW